MDLLHMRRQAMQLYEKATGRRVLSRLNELSHSQWLDQAELVDLQRRKLHRLLTYAYQYVPYYRRTFDQVGFHPDDVLDDMANLRLLPIQSMVSVYIQTCLQLGLMETSTQHCYKI